MSMNIREELWACFLAMFIRTYFKTCRIEIFGKDIDQKIRAEKPNLLYTSWHRGVLFHAYNFRDRHGAVMVSKSKDGQKIDAILRKLGFYTARGSSSRGGSTALDELIKYVEKGVPAGLTPDGPKGPPYKSKIGIIMLAARAESPLLPYAWDAYPSWEFNSWDRTILPLPFSKVVALYDREPMYIPKGLSEERYEELRNELDKRLNILTYQARYYVRNGLRNMDPRDIKIPDNYMEYLPTRKVKHSTSKDIKP